MVPWRKGLYAQEPTGSGFLFLQIHILLTLTQSPLYTEAVLMWIFPKWVYMQELSFSSVVHVIFSEHK